MVEDDKIFLRALDHVILLTVFTPLVVAHWWGTWTLIDAYIFPEDVIMRDTIILFIGCFGLMLVYILQDFFAQINNCKSILWLALNNMYIAIVAFLNICNWHGLWAFGAIVIDLAASINQCECQLMWYGLMFVIVFLMLLKTQTLKNVIAPPVVCGVDFDQDLYRCPTRFQKKGSIPIIIENCTILSLPFKKLNYCFFFPFQALSAFEYCL